MPSKAQVFSYARFSTVEQRKGDSRRRQDEGAETWCKRNHLSLDASLKYVDEGISGYRGAHRTKGKLGLFLKAVEAGLVPSGSILVVENLDRLGREAPSTTLRQTIFKLWDSGITLQTLAPEQTYPPGCDQKPEFIVLILYLQRAWDESQRKAQLANANWEEKQKQAREGNGKVTGSVPAWLKVVYDTTDPERPKIVGFKEIPEAVPVIKQIFQLKAAGLGYGYIARKLNLESAWIPPQKKGGGRRKNPDKQQATSGWRISYVKKVCINPAVLGHYQPYVTRDGKRIPTGEVIADYFPPVVDAELFNSVQAVLKGNKKNAGRIARCHNLLAHLARCAYCHGPMAYIDRGPRGGGTHLICDNGRNAARSNETGKPMCVRYSMKYPEVESLILRNCPELRPEDVLPAPSEQKSRCHSLRQSIKAHQAEIDQLDRQAANLVDQLSRTDNASVRDRYQTKVKEIDDRLTVVRKEKDAAESELKQAEGNVERFVEWQRNLESLTKLLNDGDLTTRVNLRMHLRELIDHIDCFSVGDAGDHFEEAAWAYVDEWDTKEDRKQLSAFLDELVARRHSKEGRFVRVWFRSGGYDDLVPPGSLASGWAMGARGNLSRVIEPPIIELWDEYQRSRGRKARKRKSVK
jgi:DNA invertase Pin-like site-specific DNA recombinase